MYIVFEKKTKKLLTVTNNKVLEHDDIVVKEVEDFEIAKNKVVGDLDDYKIVPKDEGVEIVKINWMKANAGTKIKSEYPLHKQLNIICGQLNSITENLKLKNNEDYDEMLNYINSILVGFEDRCKYLIEDPSIIFIDDEGHEVGTHKEYEESMTREDLLELEQIVYDIEDRRIFNTTEDSYKSAEGLRERKLKKIKKEKELNKKE
tara:strand:- start:175 stop:789 length:615 start_codon:yes stop_codon:yes gene_type:complete